METWSSRLGFLLAAVGSAVGIGNIWRFPSVVGQNGGGAYLIPYLIAVFGFGVPLMIVELAVGRHIRGDIVSTFRGIRERFQLLGWLIWAAVFTILSYYLVITGWTLAYIVFSLTDSRVPFSSFTSSYQPLLFFAASSFLVGITVSLGVRRGIERISRFLIPITFAILIGLVAFSTTLSGFGEGLGYLFTPDFSVLSDFKIWSAAFGQAFFSLSVGFGILITFGRYLDDSTDIPRSSLIIAVSDLLVSLLAGMIIFPIVFTFNLTPAVGAELAFTTLPKAFELIPFGQILSCAFFLLIFFAALTSAISMLEVNVATIMSTTRRSRRQISLILTLLLFLVGLPSALSYSFLDLQIFDVRFLDLLDETVGTLGLPITAFITAVVFTWFVDSSVLRTQIGGARLVRSVVTSATKYLIPAVLIAVTASRLFLGLDFPSWHIIPGIPFIGVLAQVIATALLMGVLLIAAFFLKRFHNRNSSRLS